MVRSRASTRYAPAAEAGGFRQRFTGNDWRLTAISWLHNIRCRLTCIFYGDQAMFVRRELVWRLGGFPERPILEDVLFSEKLRRVTRPVLLGEHALTCFSSCARAMLPRGCGNCGIASRVSRRARTRWRASPKRMCSAAISAPLRFCYPIRGRSESPTS